MSPLTSCRRESYNHVATWLADARSLASPDVEAVLVGNKADLESQREVPFAEASQFALENGSFDKSLSHEPHNG